jgi:hypothetical protein
MLSILNNGRQGAASLLPSLSAAGLRIITTSAVAGAEAAAAPSSKAPLNKEFQIYRYYVTKIQQGPEDAFSAVWTDLSFR